MTRLKFSLAISTLVFFAPAVALAHGGGGHGSMGGGSSHGMGHNSSTAGGNSVNNDVHGDDVSGAAHAAKLNDDGDTVGSDVRSVAHVKTHTSKTHTSKTKGTNNDAHGDAVSAAAKAAKLDNDGDTVGSDVRTVAHNKTHTKHHK